MRKIHSLAIRNIFRNKRRSMITALAIGFGVFVMFNSLSYVAGLYQSMLGVVMNTGIGHIQIHHQGYMKALEDRTLSSKYMLSNDDISKILHNTNIQKNTKFVTKRIIFSGLVSNGSDITNGMVMGINPKIEREFFKNISITEGAFLQNNLANKILISDRIQRVFGLKSGDTLTIATQTFDGFFNASDYKVIGVFDFGTRFNFRYMIDIFMNIEDAKALIYSQDRLTEVSIQVNDVTQLNKFKSQIENEIIKSKLNLEIHDWKTIGKPLLDIAVYIKFGMRVWTTLLFVVIVLTIVNTLLMSVFERTNEIGILQAIGMKRTHILYLFFLEAFYLSCLASFFAFILSIISVSVMNIVGVPPLLNFLPKGGLVHPIMDITDTLISLLIAISVSSLAGVFPAWKASKMDPIEALRYE